MEPIFRWAYSVFHHAARLIQSHSDLIDAVDEVLFLVSLAMFAAAVIGGGVVIRDIRLPRLNLANRLLSGFGSLALLAIVAVAYQGYRVDGTVTFANGESRDGYTMKLYRRDAVQNLPIRPDRSFSAASLESGDYGVQILRDGQIVAETSLRVDADKEISVVQSPKFGFEIYDRPTLEHLFRLAQDTDWEVSTPAVDQLADLAKQPQASEWLAERLQDPTPRRRLIAAFALARDCVRYDESVRGILETAYAENLNPFRRVKALAYSHCDGDAVQVREALVRIAAGDHDIFATIEDTGRQEAIRFQAAYYAALRGARRACLIRAALNTLRTSRYLVARQRAHEALQEMSDAALPDRYEPWHTWYAKHRESFSPCIAPRANQSAQR